MLVGVVCWRVCWQPAASDSSTSHLLMTLLFASPFTAHPNVCPKLSQMLVVDEAAVQEDLIVFKVVPGLKEEFADEKNDLVLFWATEVPVRLPALLDAAQELFLVLFVKFCEGVHLLYFVVILFTKPVGPRRSSRGECSPRVKKVAEC